MASPESAPGPPVLTVEIRILADGSVCFGDLPPDLAEVADVVAGYRPESAGSAAAAVDVGSATGDVERAAKRTGNEAKAEKSR